MASLLPRASWGQAIGLATIQEALDALRALDGRKAEALLVGLLDDLDSAG